MISVHAQTRHITYAGIQTVASDAIVGRAISTEVLRELPIGHSILFVSVHPDCICSGV